MTRYDYAFRTGTPAAGANIADIVAGTNHAAELLELWISNSAATAATVGLIRTTALGTRTTPTAMTTAVSEEPIAVVGTPELTVATAWSVAATLASPANYLRRGNVAAAIGAGLVWTWPEGLAVPVSGSASGLMLVNLGAAALPALDVGLVWEE